MSKILKNTTNSDIFVSDTGILISQSSEYTIPQQDYYLWAASNNIVTFVGNGSITVNDGSVDLSISDGIDLIKGVFQKNRIIGNTTNTLIGNVGDRLKVDASSQINTPIKFNIVANNQQLDYDGSSFNTYYSYSGSGKFYGFRSHYSNENAVTKLIIDGMVIFELTNAFLKNLSFENPSNGGLKNFLSLPGNKETLDFKLDYPIQFSSSIQIQVSRTNNNVLGGLLTLSGDISVRRYIVFISKD